MDDSSVPSTPAAAQPELGDVALHLLQPHLCLLDDQVAAPLRLADDHLGLVLRRGP